MVAGLAPRISVVIPIYNGAAYISEAVTSVLKQTVTPSEIVLLDDASTDQSLSIISRFAAEPYVRVVSLTQRVPAPAAWNAAVRASSGEYFVVLAHDDTLDPTFIAAAVEHIEQTPADLIIFGYRTVDEAGRTLAEQRLDRPPISAGNDTSSDYLDRFCREGQFFLPSGTVTRRTLFDSIGGFDERVKVAYDWDFYFRAGLGAKVTVDPRILWSYRIHATQSIAGHTTTDNGDSEYLFQKISADSFHRLSEQQRRWLIAEMCEFSRQIAMRRLRDPRWTPEQVIEAKRSAEMKLHRWQTSASPAAAYSRVLPARLQQRIAWSLMGTTAGVRLLRRAMGVRSQGRQE